jgi:ribonucleoside-triphosphate reductase
MNVIKRDGRTVEFDKQKIVAAIEGAFYEQYPYATSDMVECAEKIANEIEHISETNELHVEEIQDIVEKKLMATKYKNVAKAYINYRYLHGLARDQYKDMMDAVAEKLTAKNVQNQNANVDEASFGGRVGEASDVVMKKYALEFLVSPMARANHENNEVYIHDLNSYAVGSHNCLSIPFDDLLAKGFNTRQTDVRPAQSINTAFQLVAVIFQIQSLQQFGGVSATHLDWTMVPYVRKSFYKHYIDGLKFIEKLSDEAIWAETFCTVPVEDISINDHNAWAYQDAWEYALKMTERETIQAVEGMYHNLNTLQSRSGNQLPFSSINYGTCTLPEGRMVTKALIEASIKGVGKLHKTSIFPCGIFQCMKGVNRKPGDPNYDLFQLALKSTAQRLYPNYANVDWSGNAGYDINDPRTYFSTMGCRTANGWDINGLGQLKDGRGNICPVTIIMPTLAMEAEKNIRASTPAGAVPATNDIVDEFLRILDIKINEAKEMLIERFEWICSQSPDAAKFMYENNVMAGYIPEEGIRSALKHGTLAIGQLGLAETLQILIGCDHTEERGMDLATVIEQLFKDRCAQFKNECKLNFGVYYTPAENLCYTAMQKFKAKYGEIPNVSDKDFFTNSIHVPVWKEVDPFTKIDIESQLTGFSSAGCITYVELDASCKHNLEAIETLVNYAMDKDIPYFAINVPNDTCMKCGYTDQLNDECPMCGGEEIQRLRRVTGYLTGNYTTAFNKGKQQEVEMRVKHDKYSKR